MKSYKKSIVLKTQTGSKIANKFKMLAIIDKNHVTKHFKMMTLFNYMSILQRNWGYDSKGYTKCLNVDISFASNSFTIKSNMKNVYNVELPCFEFSALLNYLRDLAKRSRDECNAVHTCWHCKQAPCSSILYGYYTNWRMTTVFHELCWSIKHYRFNLRCKRIHIHLFLFYILNDIWSVYNMHMTQNIG